jgi:hypothetical protein
VRADDSSIDGTEELYWRAPELPLENWTVFDEGREGHRVRSGAFVWNDDGVSCFRHSILNELGLDWYVVKDEARNGVLSVITHEVRRCGLGVASDPNPDYIPRDTLQARDAAHALIVLEDGVGKKQRNKRTRELAVTAQIVHWGDDDSTEPAE